MTLAADIPLSIAPLGLVFAAADPDAPPGAQVHLRCAKDTEQRIRSMAKATHLGPSPMMAWQSDFVVASRLRLCRFDTTVTLGEGAAITVASPIPLASAILRLRFPHLEPDDTTIALCMDGNAPPVCRLVRDGDLLADAFRADAQAASALDLIAARWFAATTGVFGDAVLLDFRFSLHEVTGHARMAVNRLLAS